MLNLTQASQDLLNKILSSDSDDGIFYLLPELTPEERGNYTDLKVKGIVTSSQELEPGFFYATINLKEE